MADAPDDLGIPMKPARSSGAAARRSRRSSRAPAPVPPRAPDPPRPASAARPAEPLRRPGDRRRRAGAAPQRGRGPQADRRPRDLAVGRDHLLRQADRRGQRRGEPAELPRCRHRRIGAVQGLGDDRRGRGARPLRGQSDRPQAAVDPRHRPRFRARSATARSRSNAAARSPATSRRRPPATTPRSSRDAAARAAESRRNADARRGAGAASPAAARAPRSARPARSWRRSGTDRRRRRPGNPASAPCTHSARAGSASDARAACIRPASPLRARPRPRAASCPGARPVRLPTRKMCVSTAIVGSPKATLSTTLAVLRPTPGSVSSASRSRGTSPPCSSTSIRDSAMMFFALVRKRPIVRMNSATRSSPSASIFSGVSASGEQRRRRLVDPDIGRLRRQHDGDEQGERVDRMPSSVCGDRPARRQPPVELRDLAFRERAHRAECRGAGAARQMPPPASAADRAGGFAQRPCASYARRPMIEAAVAATIGPVFLERVLLPHRSLPPRGFNLMMLLLGLRQLRASGSSSCRSARGRSAAFSGSTCADLHRLPRQLSQRPRSERSAARRRRVHRRAGQRPRRAPGMAVSAVLAARRAGRAAGRIEPAARRLARPQPGDRRFSRRRRRGASWRRRCARRCARWRAALNPATAPE